MTIRITVALLMVALLFTMSSPRASADGPDSEGTVSSGYSNTPESSDGILGQLTNLLFSSSQREYTLSPSGCAQHAHYPHRSSHRKPAWIVNSEIESECDSPVPVMYHTAQLWEQRFWGWDRIGNRGVFRGSAVDEGSAYANDECKKNVVETIGEGYVIDVDGQEYQARTKSIQKYNPCNLP